MAQNLKEYLKENECKGFRPSPIYFRRGDFLTYFRSNERAFAKRLDDTVTVYLSLENDELVGCKIKGISCLLNAATDFGVLVADGKLRDGSIKLGFFLYASAGARKEKQQQELYKKLAPFSDVEIERDSLQPA